MIGIRSYLVTLLSLCALAGCSMDKPGSPAAPSTSGGGSGKSLKIAGMGFQNDQFFKIAEFGMKDAATKNGVELSLANSGGSLEKELSLIDTYTASKVNAIVMAPSNPKSSVSAL